MEEKELYQEEVVQNPSNVKGMVALIAGLTSFFVTGIAGSIVAIVFGTLAKNTAGEKMGKIGKICGIINIIVYAASMGVFVVFYVLYILMIVAGIAMSQM